VNLLLRKGIKEEYAKTTFSPISVRSDDNLARITGLYAERKSRRHICTGKFIRCKIEETAGGMAPNPDARSLRCAL
jgi:hypothetical protein